MNKWTLLLILIGLGAVAMINRDKISAYMAHKPETEEGSTTPSQITPHPAQESIAKARKTYPALGVADSAFNKKFVELYNGKKSTDPTFLASADWPMQLAQQTASALGGPVSTHQPPTEASKSALNARPPNFAGATAPPSIQLPGLKGSALDQRPPERYK